MKSIYLKSFLGSLVILGGAISAQAQDAPRPPLTLDKLGPQIRVLVQEHRDTTKALLEQRKALIEQLKAAQPDAVDGLKTELRAIMREHQQDQRELARDIRDAIKARRDAIKAQRSTDS